MAIFMAAFAAKASADNISFDIVISGGSFSASAAAFAAARTQPTAQVLLIEPTDWLGGQATVQGVSAIDNAYGGVAGPAMRDNLSTYYPADYLNWLNRMKRPLPGGAPGLGYAGSSGWVSRDCFDARTGAWALDQIAATFPNLTVLKMTVVKNVQTTPVSDAHGAGSRITGLTLITRTAQSGYAPFTDYLSAELPDWYSSTDSSRFTKQVHTVSALTPAKGLVVIEASELGDVMVLSGATYTQGREISTEFIGEDGTLPAYHDAESMAMVYPFAMTTATTANDELSLKTPWADFDSFYALRSSNYFSLGSTPWTQVWTYRRLYVPSGGSNSTTTINIGDVSMQNWNPGNDYRQENWLLGKAATNAQASDWQGAANLTTLSHAEEQAIAWYFWLKNRKPASGYPTADTHFLSGSDTLNMMGTPTGLAKFPYIRCMRRIVGLDNFRITSRYFVNSQATGYTNETSYRYFDSVGIGSYPSDVRPLLTSTGLTPPISQPGPFYIPYRALASRNVRNLLASGKAMAQTYITNPAYRLHPIEWQSGSAAGVAAALLWRDAADNYELLNITSLRELQTTVATNAPIKWAYRSEPLLPPEDGDLVVNSFRGVDRNTPYDIEAYHPTAVRAEIYVEGALIGETTTRSNGRLLFHATDLASTVSPAAVEARCYDGSGTLIATLTANVVVSSIALSCEAEPGVTDNDATDGYFTTVGVWGSGTAQANRWCAGSAGASYTLTNNNDGLRTATWRLRTGQPGMYMVSVWYPESNNRATDAHFTVYHRNGTDVQIVNQRINGGQWVELGIYPLNGDASDRVELRNNQATDANGQYIIADAVRALYQSAFPSTVEAWMTY